MEEVIHLRTTLLDKINNSKLTGERIYFEKKLGILDVLLNTILRDASPSDEELEFYILSFKLDELKKGDNKKLTEELEKKVSELRLKVIKTPQKRMFQ